MNPPCALRLSRVHAMIGLAVSRTTALVTP
jgi:hypothetical protein